jgi:hypothetical protein
MLTLIDTASEAVRQSLTSFVESRDDCNPNELSAELVSTLSQGLAASFQHAGQEALKAFIEQYESTEEVIERDGRIYRLKDASSRKTFLTDFGATPVSRRYYHDRDGGKGLVPLDERWGMAGRYATAEVVEKVLWASGTLVASEVSEAMNRLCGIKISTSCVQDIISKDGLAIAEMIEDEEAGVAVREIEVPEETEVMVASFDGANLLLRQKGTRPGRKSQRPGLHDADDDEEKKQTCYKNAMVGSFSFYQTVDGVVDIKSGVEGTCPHRLHSVYCARMPEEGAVGFKEEFESIVENINAKAGNSEMTKILLADGARPIWKYVKGNALYKDFRLLLDYFHASEHLSLASEAIFGKESADAADWYDKWCHKLKFEKGAADGILRSMKHYQEAKRLSKCRREDLKKQMVFFKRNKEFMNYYEHVANGWPIGSGPVEAACKSIVKARLCQSGMRWSTRGGRNVLALRVLKQSKQWDTVWRKYQADKWAAAA